MNIPSHQQAKEPEPKAKKSSTKEEQYLKIYGVRGKMRTRNNQKQGAVSAHVTHRNS
jgi:hypothetical protein